MPVWWYSRELVRLNNMPVTGSSPEWIVPPFVGLTIILCKSSESLAHSWYRQALTDNSLSLSLLRTLLLPYEQ